MTYPLLPNHGNDEKALASATDYTSGIEHRFSQLHAAWKKDTSRLSSVHDIVDHPAYKEIISMGSAVVPIILRSLRNRPDHWFVALGHLTGENPVRPVIAGNMDRMAAAWVQWGLEKGLLQRE